MEGLNTLQSKRFSEIVGLIPGTVVAIYFFGYVVLNSYLLNHGIVERDFLNIDFLKAGALYSIYMTFTAIIGKTAAEIMVLEKWDAIKPLLLLGFEVTAFTFLYGLIFLVPVPSWNFISMTVT